MLFYLTNSLLVEPSDAEYADIFDAVRNITASAVRGKHLVNADYEALVVFEKWYERDPVIGFYFHQLKENYSTSVVPSFLTYYIQVVKDAPSQFVEGDSVGVLKYTVFLDIDTVSQCSLIAENDYDCSFYRYILSWYLKTQHSGLNITTSFTDVNGSGGETPSAIQKELNKKHVSVCIVDTDVRYPGDVPKSDSTCCKCRRVNKIVPFYRYMELDVHEIENLIPINYLLLVDGWHGEAVCKKNAFEKICNNSTIMRFFDIKEGICRSSVPDDELYLFGQLCYESNPEFVQKCSYQEKYDSGDMIIYPGLIARALKKTIELINRGLTEPPTLLDFQENHWKGIGALLLNFGIASNSERIY